nr:odorant-binding protein 99a-2 [Fopius arisanus]
MFLGFFYALLDVSLHTFTDLAGHHTLVTTIGPHISAATLDVLVCATLSDSNDLSFIQIHFELLGNTIGMIALMFAEDTQFLSGTKQVLAYGLFIGIFEVLHFLNVFLAEWEILDAFLTDSLDLGNIFRHPFFVGVCQCNDCKDHNEEFHFGFWLD